MTTQDPAVARARTARSARRAAPWAMSIGVHAILLLIGFAATWTVLQVRAPDAAEVITADFDALTLESLRPLALDAAPTPVEAPAAPPLPAPAPGLSDRPLAEQWTTPGTLGALTFGAPDGALSTSFAGVKATNARRIAFVIDASGSMISSFQIVVDELRRSIGAMTERQSFGIVFFQRNEALVVPPRTDLQASTAAHVDDAFRWIDRNVMPRGRSNPVEALRQALRWDPDVVFLLSVNITGAGDAETDVDALLADLERLNPTDEITGRRRSLIKCIQFLDPDPLDTLRRIAERHGGADGFKFLDRAELGLVAPGAPVAPPTP